MSRCHSPTLNPRQASWAVLLVSLVSVRAINQFLDQGSFAGWDAPGDGRARPPDRWVPQQSVRFWARPASLVSLYFALMSLPVSARVLMVVSRSTRWREAISLVAIMAATQAFTAPNAQRSMQGTWTWPATGSQVMP